MNVQADSFADYCKKIAADFLQTAIFIDNEAVLPGADDPTHADSPSRTAQMVDTDPLSDPGGAIVADHCVSRNAAEPKTEARGTGLINFKAITDCFRAHGILCGLYMPLESEKDLVAKAVHAASNADLVVVDWYLQGNSSGAAKEIIAQLIKKDRESKGRFRLIAVYTSETDLPGRAKELIENQDFVDARGSDEWTLDPDKAALLGPHSRIVFVGKTDLAQPATPAAKAPEALADYVIEEFATLTKGLLPSFALSAVTAIRREAHHIVSNFDARMDGPYILHRALLPDPDEAIEFAAELILSQLANVIATADVAEETLNIQRIEPWLREEHHPFSVAKEPSSGDLSLDELQVLISAGSRGFKEVNEKRKDKKPNVKENKFPRLIGYTGIDQLKLLKDFARLVTYRREAYGKYAFPDHWRPSLTLGSVVRLLKNTGERTDQLFYCVQPRCDSVRLEDVTAFPFQKVTAPVSTDKSNTAQAKANLVVATSDTQVELKYLHQKPRDIVVYEFKPDPKRRCVAADRKDGRFIFTDVEGKEFEWLGDVEKLKAQREASKVAADLHRVGIDDFEWLHRLAEGKLEIPT